MMSSDRNSLRIALIGFGEVGRRFAGDLRGNGGIVLSAFDILANNSSTRDGYEHAARELSVATKGDARSACVDTDLIISAVTAAATERVAEEAAGFMKRGQIFFDVNSASPQTKQRASRHLEKAGADYVEGAVMAPVKKPGIRVQILAGGIRAEETAKRLNAFGFNIRAVAQEIGVASATKLCRSIIIKGLETLMVDCARASEHAGVEEDVFESLGETFPGINWRALAEDMKERVATHGIRRSEEMHEAANMVADFGIDDELVRAVANAQARGTKRHG
jgi:3-hydroxyisobutyrate dehydrogenase-like beta-hydroxyacid dehydrogenase